MQPKCNKYITNSHLRLFHVDSLIHNLFRVKLIVDFSFCIQLVKTRAPVISNDTTHTSQRSLYIQVFIAICRIAHYTRPRDLFSVEILTTDYCSLLKE